MLDSSRILFHSLASFVYRRLVISLYILTTLSAAHGQVPLQHNIQKIEDPYDQLGNYFIAKNALVEDSLGYLWIGSRKGLCRYSGSTIKCYTHTEEDANSIDGNIIIYVMVDSSGLIWTAIHELGVNVFDLNGKKILDLDHDPNDENSLLHDRVWGMWEDEAGYIWISYFYGGLSRYDKATGNYLHISIDDEDFLQDYRPKTVVSVQKHYSEANTYWLATTRGLVKFNASTHVSEAFLFSQKIQQETTQSQGNKTKIEPLWCRSMDKDATGNLWLGTFGALVYFDTSTETYEVLRQVNGKVLNNVTGVMAYDEAHIMVSAEAGLSLLHTDFKKLTTLSQEDGISPNYKLNGRFYKTSDGCTYILSRSQKGGIHKYCPASDRAVDYRTGGKCFKLAVTNNYVHYRKGLGYIESRHLETGEIVRHQFERKSGTTIQAIHALNADSLLVCDKYEAYYYTPDDGLTKIDAFSQLNVHRHEAIFRDSNGDLWNGKQRKGLYYLPQGDSRSIHYDHQSDPAIVYQDYIVDFLEDESGKIWVATEQGWTVFDKIDNTTSNYLSADICATYEGSKFRSITALAQSSADHVWLATSANGIIEWDIKQERINRHITTATGLRSDVIYDIAADQEGHLWLGSNAGLTYVDPDSGQVRNFGKECGIARAVYTIDFDQDSHIYLAHGAGFYTVSIDSLLSIQASSPTAQITGFKLYDRVQDTLLAGEKGITLPHDENFFSLSFGSINYVDSHLEDYEYRLVGVDREWRRDRGDRESAYTNVQPGRYTFEVRVHTEASDWSPAANLSIRILPPWYETWWFRILLSLAIVLTVLTTIRSVIRRQQRELEIDKRFAQLETMVLKSQMNPHFIFNSMNSIRYLFMMDEKEKGLSYITKFARLLRTTLHHGDQAMVRLVEEIELTELFVELEQLRFNDSFSFTTEYDAADGWKAVPIPPFVIQPIVENAFWHGLLPSKKTEKNLEIAITTTPTGYQISIEDNGVGLQAKSSASTDPELNKTKSYGLNIIRERFDLINKSDDHHYSLTIADSDRYDTGAKVVITIDTKPPQ